MSHPVNKMRQPLPHAANRDLHRMRCHADSLVGGNLLDTETVKEVELKQELVARFVGTTQGQIQAVVDLIVQFHHANAFVGRRLVIASGPALVQLPLAVEIGAGIERMVDGRALSRVLVAQVIERDVRGDDAQVTKPGHFSGTLEHLKGAAIMLQQPQVDILHNVFHGCRQCAGMVLVMALQRPNNTVPDGPLIASFEFAPECLVMGIMGTPSHQIKIG